MRRAPWLAPAAALLVAACGEVKPLTAPPLGPGEHLVSVADFSFTPAEIVIRPGDRVTWRNSGTAHNVRAENGTFRCARGCDGAGGNGELSAEAWTFTLTFNQEGSVDYFCESHGAHGGIGMAGRVVVRAAVQP
jgi:plastocyanin